MGDVTGRVASDTLDLSLGGPILGTAKIQTFQRAPWTASHRIIGQPPSTPHAYKYWLPLDSPVLHSLPPPNSNIKFLLVSHRLDISLPSIITHHGRKHQSLRRVGLSALLRGYLPRGFLLVTRLGLMPAIFPCIAICRGIQPMIPSVKSVCCAPFPV